MSDLFPHVTVRLHVNDGSENSLVMLHEVPEEGTYTRILGRRLFVWHRCFRLGAGDMPSDPEAIAADLYCLKEPAE